MLETVLLQDGQSGRQAAITYTILLEEFSEQFVKKNLDHSVLTAILLSLKFKTDPFDNLLDEAVPEEYKDILTHYRDIRNYIYDADSVGRFKLNQGNMSAGLDQVTDQDVIKYFHNLIDIESDKLAAENVKRRALLVEESKGSIEESKGENISYFQFMGQFKDVWSQSVQTAITNNDLEALENLCHCGTVMMKSADASTVDILCYRSGIENALASCAQGTDNSGNNMLLYAAHNNHSEFAANLILAGSDVSVVSEIGNTALHYAAYNNNVALTQLLIDKNKEINGGVYKETRNKEGDSPHYIASIRDNVDVLDLLLENSSNPSDYLTSFLNAAANGKIKTLEYIYNKKDDLINASHDDEADDESYKGHTAIFLASEKGHVEAVRWLLDKGANQYLENNEYDGFTPLHVAINCGYQNVANLLLDHQQQSGNIDVNAFDYDNVTPLHLAAEKGFKDIANRLIALGANCEAEDKEGRTLLDYSADHPEVMAIIEGEIARRRRPPSPDISTSSYGVRQVKKSRGNNGRGGDEG